MAVGYPDYFGMPIFPHYGPLVFDEGNAVNVAGIATTVILNLEGKQQLQELNMFIRIASGGIEGFFFHIDLDGVETGHMWITHRIGDNRHLNNISMINLSYLDPVNSEYNLRLTHPIEFNLNWTFTIYSTALCSLNTTTNYMTRMIL